MDAVEAMSKLNEKRHGRSVDFTGTVTEVSSEKKQADDGSVKTEVVKAQSDDIESQTSNSCKEEARLVVLKDLQVYTGDSLERKIDSFIAAHPVVVFNKSWCLFSIDAQDFLIHTLKVTVHTIELDTHSQGKAIHEYIIQKTGHSTLPVIFIKGDFLGGFEDVNAMYASGKLEDEYLGDLTQADRCEQFISKSQLTTKPLFCFPERVNGDVVRITGVLSSLCSATAAGLVHLFTWGEYFTYGICAEFLLRFFTGARFSPLGRIGTILASPLEPNMRIGRPKQFSAFCGFLFALFGSISYAVEFPHHDIVGSIFMGMLAIATGMEGLLDFCVGCFIFKYGVKFGLIQK